MSSQPKLIPLHELQEGQFADCFVLLESKERSKTRDGKPYYKIAFGDGKRTTKVMIWGDSNWFGECETTWKPGDFYKIRGEYSESKFGPQIEIDRIRPVCEDDREHGFEPTTFFKKTRFDVNEMFSELTQIASDRIEDPPLQQLVLELLNEHVDLIKRIAAASRNHHAFSGGYLEHTLSVTRTAVFLADKYDAYYPDMNPPLNKSIVVAGAILHDIGKVLELECQAGATTYTAAGRLVGHILLGRDIVREKAVTIPNFDREILLRLEHVIIAHQNLPEWGSPIAPHTPEAMLVHYADDLDAKFHEMAIPLIEMVKSDEQFTSIQNPLRRRIFRGLDPIAKETT